MKIVKQGIFIFILPFILLADDLPEGIVQPVYRLNPTREFLIGISGVGLCAAGIMWNQEVVPLTPEEIDNLSPSHVNSFDRSATRLFSKRSARLSDVLIGFTVLAPIGLFSKPAIRQEWKTVGIMYLEAMVFSRAIPLISKAQARRIRPYVYNDRVPLEEKMDQNALRSFYSGHATYAFASAVFLSTVYQHYHPDSKYKTAVWAGSLSLASSVGYLRYRSGKHFPSDVLMGAAVGSVIGWLVPAIHQVKSPNFSVTMNTTETFFEIGMTILR